MKQEDFWLTDGIMIAIVIVFFIMLYMVFYENNLYRDESSLRQQVQGNYTLLMKDFIKLKNTYRIINPMKVADKLNCTKTTLWVKYNETGECFRQLENKTLEEYDSIANLCPQQVLIQCQ